MRLKVTRTVTWSIEIDENAYPDMTLEEAAEHEKGLELDEVIELIGDAEDADMKTEVEFIDAE